MSKPEKSYLEIIKWIDSQRDRWTTPRPRFAIWEISLQTNIGRNHIRRVLTRLEELRYVYHYPKGFAHRQWKMTHKWIDVNEVIDDYETYKLVKGG